jgi:hypothetical protein
MWLRGMDYGLGLLMEYTINELDHGCTDLQSSAGGVPGAVLVNSCQVLNATSRSRFQPRHQRNSRYYRFHALFRR